MRVGDAVVGSGMHQSVRGKGSGDGGSGGRRRQGGGITEETKSNTPGTEHQKRVQVANLTN